MANKKQDYTENYLLGCLLETCRLLGRDLTLKELFGELQLNSSDIQKEHVPQLVNNVGFNAIPIKEKVEDFPNEHLPAILLMKNDEHVVLKQTYANGTVDIYRPYPEKDTQNLKIENIRRRYTGKAIYLTQENPIETAGIPLKIDPNNWFWGTIRQTWPMFTQVAIAALLANLLALATPLFIMNVYDRVVPNQAVETLWVLASGVILAFVFEFILKTLRGYFIDHTGRDIDIALSSALYEQVTNARLTSRPKSSGGFAHSLKEFEHLREFFTSTAISTFIDLPFVVFFVGIIYFIGGEAAFPIMIALPIVLALSYAIQKPMTLLIHDHLKEGSEKHSVLIETLNNLETVKSNLAQDQLYHRWLHAAQKAAHTAKISKFFSSIAVNFAQFSQQIVTISVVIVGVHLMQNNELTVGALVACTMLTGRSLAPVARIAGLFSHYHRAMSSLKSLDHLMSSELEMPENKTFLNKGAIHGAFEFEDVRFRYPHEKLPALKNINLSIRKHEKVAIVGRTGSGKSSLLKLMMNLYVPNKGVITVDGIEISQVNPNDLRASIGYMPQEVQLFSGSVRDNILIGQADISDRDFIRICEISGVHAFTNIHPDGYDMQVGENGSGLSGGQRQSVALARALIHNPATYIMDEPTSALDNHAEAEFIRDLKRLLHNKTFIISTHRMALLELVDRIIVMDSGVIIADGQKDDILKTLTKGEI